MERLDAEDEVHIFCNANSKAFSAEKKATITANKKCSVAFQVAPTTANSVDFAIAVEVAKRFAEEKDTENMYILISKDKHFDTIVRELNRVFNLKKAFNCTESIDEALAKYALLKIEDEEHLWKYLLINFGQARAKAIFGSMTEIFLEQDVLVKLKKGGILKNDVNNRKGTNRFHRGRRFLQALWKSGIS